MLAREKTLTRGIIKLFPFYGNFGAIETNATAHVEEQINYYVKITSNFYKKDEIHKNMYIKREYKRYTYININETIICCNLNRQFYEFSDFYIILQYITSKNLNDMIYIEN